MDLVALDAALSRLAEQYQLKAKLVELRYFAGLTGEQAAAVLGNCDQLYAIFTGQLDLLTGAITARVTFVGGTGRYDDTGGSATLSGQMLPDGTIAVAVEGTIDY